MERRISFVQQTLNHQILDSEKTPRHIHITQEIKNEQLNVTIYLLIFLSCILFDIQVYSYQLISTEQNFFYRIV